MKDGPYLSSEMLDKLIAYLESLEDPRDSDKTEMNITVKREIYTDKSTIGSLFIGDRFECYTLEDVVRPSKIKGETAIDAGKYEVIVNFSNRFQQPMPLLLNVPEFLGVRIHSGNYASHTEGCLLCGSGKGENAVWDSRKAYKKLFRSIQMGLEVGKVFINIKDKDGVIV